VKRVLLLAGVIVLASLAVVSVASAHSFTATISCTQVAYNFSAFPAGSAVIHEQVTIDGSPVAAQDYTLVVPPAAANTTNQGSSTIAIIVSPGTHTVAATATWTVDGGGGETYTQTLSSCSTATPALTTAASGPVTVGGAIHDTAHLSGGFAPVTGTLSFDVYDSTCATKLGAVAATAAVNGAGDYDSANFSPTAAGTYKWVAHYSGDANNAKVDTACGAAGETSTVTTTTPAIATLLSAGTVTTGASVHDSALLSGASANGTGAVTYSVYTNTACNAGAQAAGTKTLTSGGVPNSDEIVFSTAGDYYWQAVYSGDANNAGAASVCTSEHLVVNRPSTPSNPSTPETPTTPSTPQVTTAVTPPPPATPQPTTPATQTPTPTTHTPTPAPKPKAKPKKSFAPPVVRTKVQSPPPPCYTIAVGQKNLTIGKPGTLELRVTGRSKPIPGVKVSVKGAGIQVLSGRTNNSGHVTLTVRPMKPGIVSFRAAAQKSCNTARVGVVSAFTPPVTG